MRLSPNLSIWGTRGPWTKTIVTIPVALLVLMPAFSPVLTWAGSEPPAQIRAIPQDLMPPPMTETVPGPGRRVKGIAREYRGTDVHHTLYLPTDWQPGKRFPVIVEYAGNGPYSNEHGGTCSGRVEDCCLGYGMSAGRGFIWVCLPYISKDRQRNQRQWWGDIEATVAYCKIVIPRICSSYGGDTSALLLAGFSRGAIACNFIGLHDEEIAALWRGFVCHSHYDGVRKWDYQGSDRRAAALRLKRLNNRPQFISHELSVKETRDYLSQAYPQGNFRFQVIPFVNHTDTWVLRDIPARRALRQWLNNILRQAPPLE